MSLDKSHISILPVAQSDLLYLGTNECKLTRGTRPSHRSRGNSNLSANIYAEEAVSKGPCKLSMDEPVVQTKNEILYFVVLFIFYLV